MRSCRHWTPRYIVNRLRVIGYELKYPEAPWLTRSMVEILESWLRPSDVGLEFGSGRSTIWFAGRVDHLISVEHDSGWYANVMGRLRQRGIADRVDYRLFEDGATESDTSQYVKVVRELAPLSLDFCLVDGMGRDHCALESLDHLKPGGILIIDNINWYLPRESQSASPYSRRPSDGFASKTWSQFANAVKEWRCIWTTNGVWDTALWVKPVLMLDCSNAQSFPKGASDQG